MDAVEIFLEDELIDDAGDGDSKLQQDVVGGGVVVGEVDVGEVVVDAVQDRRDQIAQQEIQVVAEFAPQTGHAVVLQVDAHREHHLGDLGEEHHTLRVVGVLVRILLSRQPYQYG